MSEAVTRHPVLGGVMGREPAAVGWGWITEADAACITTALHLIAATFPDGPLRICEIGVFQGDTGRAMQRELGRTVAYWGVDPETITRMGDAHMVCGDSQHVWPQVPYGLHFLWIDGCHCQNHAITDFVHYGQKVVVGGMVGFHDTHPGAQAVDNSYQGHGPRGEVGGQGVRVALGKLGLLTNQDRRWRLVADQHAGTWGGTVLVERVA